MSTHELYEYDEYFDDYGYGDRAVTTLKLDAQKTDKDDEVAPVAPKVKAEKTLSLVDDSIERLKTKRSELKVQIRNLQSYPADDSTCPNGTVLIWHENIWAEQHFAAVKENDRWYITGEFHSRLWDELVSSCLSAHDYSEIEVVLPAEDAI